MIESSLVTDWLLQHGVRILVIVVISLVVYLVMKKLVPTSVQRTLSRTMHGRPKAEVEKRRATLTRLIVSLGFVVISVISAILILAELGIDIAALLVSFGVVGIAVGFAAQSLVKDLIAGFIILLENQFNVGDVVRIADIAGGVEGFNIRRTLLRDLDGTLHSVSNGEIRVTSNFTKMWSRAHLNISVAYKEDVDHVMSVIRKTWEEMAEDPDWKPLLISKTPWLLRVDAFGDSGVVIKVVGETQPIKQWDVMGELRRRIKRNFDEQGIEIPWPHTKVYFGDDLKLADVQRFTEHH